MTYTEKELDQFLHGISLSLLSKKSAQHWRYDEETAKEIEWLEALERKVRADKADRKTEPTAYADGYADGQRDERERWERMADRKTENSSEIPNNCEDLQDWKDRMWAEAIVTEPTISKMEQVEDEQITSKLTDAGNSMVSAVTSTMEQLKSKLKDEPQTERSE